MDSPELYARLLEDAQRYDPTAHNRGLLAPYRDVLLLQRAKFMSYEQIAATLNRHGLKVSPAAVGVFCRRNFTKAEIERVRQSPSTTTTNVAGRRPAGSSAGAPTFGVSAPGSSVGSLGKRGPKIARDNY
ncbi:hypothetical protein OH491_26470 [Termitidicoccus mucosus]|uniref:hypothetical protein n=1 Tax=Termitidicoccus mucosus TaxID=1184151 RepID=UPI0011AB4498